MNKLTFLLLIIFLSASSFAQVKPNTDWFSQAEYGIFVHFLPEGNDFQKRVDEFDVKAFAQDCADAGAGYVFFTLAQNSGYFNVPNKVYDKYAGIAPGVRSSKRDIVADLAKALNQKDIKLMLYASGDVPGYDSIIAKKLGAKDFNRNGYGENWKFNDLLVKRWAEVMQEWSDRYGSLVYGWWIDGCYAINGFNNEYGRIFVKALKHGNPKAIVALNPGVGYDLVSDAQDFLAGEDNNILGANCTHRWKDGVQWHQLSFLGKYWSSGNPSCTAEQLIDYLKNNVMKNGGVLSIDVPLSGSRINETHLKLLKEVKASIRENTQ